MTSTTNPVPVAIFGKDPNIARAVSEKLLPDFEVVHVCLNLRSALDELPALFALQHTTTTTTNPDTLTTVPTTQPIPTPSSGLGTNATPDDPTNPFPNPYKKKIPRALFFGGKFTDEEYHALVNAIKARLPAPAKPLHPERRTVGGSGPHFEPKPGTVLFIKVQKRDVFAAGGFGPNPDVIARVFRKKVAAAVERERAGGGAGGGDGGDGGKGKKGWWN